jgi:polysaccharide pyruvyl transferase WcaK-like protein
VVRVRFARRKFLAGGVGIAAAASGSGCSAPAPPPEPPPRRPKILLRSGWQTENIGDIAHTPGVLRLLQIHVPEADTILWSNALNRGVREMLVRHFPNLGFVSGNTDAEGAPDNAALDAAFREADLLLHGSGPSVVARVHLDAWRKHTGKPYGIFGVTVALREEAASPAVDPLTRPLLEGAAFVFTRETASLANLERTGFKRARFAPDGTFSLKLADEEAARRFLAESALEPKRFIAVVPRLRYTPYHQFRKVSWTAEEIRRRTAVNQRFQESDHARLREAIVAWVRETGHKVLLCPEMTYQLEIIGPLLYDPLPPDVKERTVRRQTYWLPDEASSVYRRATAVVSCECHSPIIAAVNDTPGIYVRQPEDGIKGRMWEDIGLGGWCLDIERTSGATIAKVLREIHGDYARAQVDVHEAVLYARKLQADAMAEVRKTLAL